ncbi:MAG: hypothetical protein VZR54_06440 [Ruminococcus sp.]|nr:hypothetical protein [Ruminococcus sp.]
MRSSNLSHLEKPAKTRRYAKKSNAPIKLARLGSIIATAVLVFSAVIIPSVTLVQNVEAVTNKKNTVFAVGDNTVFSNVIENSAKPKSDPKEAPSATAVKPVSKTVETQPQTAKPEPATEKATEKKKPASTNATETAQTSEAVSVSKNKGSLTTADSDSGYSPRHVSLSSYDRAKLERLVMGEAGGLGYNGAALVAQTIRDSMIESDTNSIDYIINEYQYTGSTEKEPTSAVKSAVSMIFDNDGYAVKHRLLYFYASDLVSNAWHETQHFIIEYGNERFFDRWD